MAKKSQISREKTVKAGMQMRQKNTLAGVTKNIEDNARNAKRKVEPTESDLITALRLIKLRWDGLDDDERKMQGATFGIYFTARQLEALEGYFHKRVKETR